MLTYIHVFFHDDIKRLKMLKYDKIKQEHFNIRTVRKKMEPFSTKKKKLSNFRIIDYQTITCALSCKLEHIIQQITVIIVMAFLRSLWLA